MNAARVRRHVEHGVYNVVSALRVKGENGKIEDNERAAQSDSVLLYIFICVIIYIYINVRLLRRAKNIILRSFAFSVFIVVHTFFLLYYIIYVIKMFIIARTWKRKKHRNV